MICGYQRWAGGRGWTGEVELDEGSQEERCVSNLNVHWTV